MIVVGLIFRDYIPTGGGFHGYNIRFRHKKIQTSVAAKDRPMRSAQAEEEAETEREPRAKQSW